MIYAFYFYWYQCRTNLDKYKLGHSKALEQLLHLFSLRKFIIMIHSI